MTIFSRFIDNIKVLTKQVTFGQVIILLGLRGKGKSETIKSLCKRISGKKYIVMVDENLSALPMNPEDKKDYEKLPGCKVIEKDQDIKWESGTYIFEDFPMLTDKSNVEFYNKIKTARNFGLNFIIIAHDYKVLKGTTFSQSNAILLYQDAVITPHQLNPKIGGLKEGFAINRALLNLPKYHYIFVSFDHKKWANPSIDSKKTDILGKAIRGNLKKEQLQDINYPKKTLTTKISTNKKTKRAEIISMLKIGSSYEEIKDKLKTSLDTIYKIKSQEKRRYKEENGLNKNCPENKYPSWLRDRR